MLVVDHFAALLENMGLYPLNGMMGHYNLNPIFVRRKSDTKIPSAAWVSRAPSTARLCSGLAVVRPKPQALFTSYFVVRTPREAQDVPVMGQPRNRSAIVFSH